MSFDAIRWALSQSVPKSSTKFVLVAMADCVNQDGGPDMLCWPSYQHLKTRTGQDIKTVEAGLRMLRELGFIVDTMERKGSTGQVIVYRLNTPEIGAVSPLPKIDATALNTPKLGAVDTGGKTPVFPAKTPKFPIKDPRFSHQRPPKTGDGTSNGTSNGTSKEPVSVTQIDGVSDSLLTDYLVVRKAKKAGALTKTAVDGIAREAAKAGLPIGDAIRVCCEQGWQGFNAGWYGRLGNTGQHIKPNSPGKHAGFDLLDYREGIAEDGTIA
ncbi:MAG: helix-turn-helix domain-containing protein [Burkholderiales bacterium]|nr:helix-turn-helix domain-containing protein [Burkholderiales bacterium]